MRKPLSELMIDFLSEQDISENSRNTYKTVLNRFVRWIVVQGIDFWSIKRSNIIDYKTYISKQNKSSNTIDLYLTVIRKLFKWLDNNGLYDNIATGIHSPKRYRGHRKGYLQIDQVSQLLNSIDKSTIIGARDYAIVSLMVRAGLRRVEVCRMTYGDLEIGKNITLRIQRKGHIEKDCVIGITGKMLKALQSYINMRGVVPNGQPLFVSHARGYNNQPLSAQSIARIVKQYMAIIGVTGKGITCHSLRHTAAILSLKAGATIDEVQQMLGHTSIETTKIYLSAIEEETRLNNPAVHVLDTLF